MEKTFRPSYLPKVFAEFTAGKEFDFEDNFDVIMEPLVAQAYVLETNGAYALTENGKHYIKNTINSARYKETEL